MMDAKYQDIGETKSINLQFEKIIFPFEVFISNQTKKNPEFQKKKIRNFKKKKIRNFKKKIPIRHPYDRSKVLRGDWNRDKSRRTFAVPMASFVALLASFAALLASFAALLTSFVALLALFETYSFTCALY